MEGDFWFFRFPYGDQPFQSTPSAWRETIVTLTRLVQPEISIHSLRMEGDTISDYSI